MEENYVATVFEKMLIAEDVYIFRPLHIIEGKYTENTSIFIDDYEKIYYDISEAHLGLNDVGGYFGFPENLNTIKKYYNIEDSKDAIKAYFETISENIYFGVVSEAQDEIVLLDAPLDEIVDLVLNQDERQGFLKTSEGNNNSANQEIETNFYFKEEAIKNLLMMENISEVKAYLNKVLAFGEHAKELVANNIEPEPLSKIQLSEQDNINTNKMPFNISEMYDYVTSKVINQDEAVKKIIMSFALNHIAVNSDKLKTLQPTRTLITGSTGVGKTLILETILEYLEENTNINIPMVKVPTSQLTVAGYVGMNLEDILEELVSKVKNIPTVERQVEFAERNGIVFLDEIDKKGSNSNGDVSGRGVLNSLLQFLDGATYQIAVNRTPFYFNTKYLNIFASGAFTNVKDELNKSSIGFGANHIKTQNNLKVSDYIEKGEMPSEFMGRFHQIVTLNSLEISDLKDILTKSIASPILVEQEKLKLIGLNLIWDETFIEEIAKKAYNLKLGARSLKTIIEEALFDLKWEALSKCRETSILVTRETVENPKQYRII